MRHYYFIIAVLMLLALSLCACAEQAVQPLADEISVGTDAVDYAAYHTAYASRVMGLSSGSGLTPRSGETFLNERQRSIYKVLKDAAVGIAAGSRESSIIQITYGDVGWFEGKRFYDDDLGLDIQKVYTTDDSWYQTLVYAMFNYYCRAQLNQIMWTVVRDNPYEFYWFANILTSGAVANGLFPYVEEDGNRTYAILTGCTQETTLFKVCYGVSEQYSNGASMTVSGTEIWTGVNTEKTSAATNAANNAKTIIDTVAGMSDVEKLEIFVAQIRSLCEYDEDAAAGGNPSINSGPWEIINVFDGDTSTKVVCEGYSKALQYLVKRSSFQDPTLECYCMSGWVVFGTGNEGPHMWNMIVKQDGNFMVDVTNCSEEPQAGGRLFMVVSTDEDPTKTITKNGREYTGKYTVSGYQYYFDPTMSLLPQWLKTYCRHADHDKAYQYVQEPTCSEAGSGYPLCGHCGKQLDATVEEIPALPHTPKAVEATEATCTEPARTAGEICSVCKTWITEPQEEGDSLGHEETDIPAQDPSCTKAGHGPGVRCSRCTDVLVTPELIDALGHEEKPLIGKEPSCTEKGLTEGKGCTRCDFTPVPQEQIDALGHDVKDVPAKPATCTEPGYTAGTKCSRCDYWETKSNPIAAKGHTSEAIPAVAATCAQTGLTAGSKCSVCGEPLTVQQTVDKLPHTPQDIPGKAATCKESGLTTGSKCSVCGEPLVAQQTIGMLPHTPQVIPGKDATCKESGLTVGSKCSVCGDTLTAQVTVDKLPHTPQAIPGKDATCKESGLTVGSKCAECGEILTAQMTVDKLPHTAQDITGKAATCTETGLTTGSKCSECGEILLAQQKLDKLPHTPQDIPGKDATCTEPGLTTGVRCSVCQDTLVEQTIIPAMGHKMERIPSVIPTKDENGKTEGRKCGRCGEVFTEQVSVPVLITDNCLELPSEMSIVADYALAGTGADSCRIPASVRQIGAYVLKDSSVTQIHIRCADATINENAFAGLIAEKIYFFAPAGNTLDWLIEHGYPVVQED